MIDAEGFRLNVGMVICNRQGKVFWARKIGRDSWQFPQGGLRPDESPEAAMFRELYEETGLAAEHVHVLGRTRNWLQYRLPERFIRRDSLPLCIGQRQLWYLLRLVGDEGVIRFDCTDEPEFDSWRWVEYWQPVDRVVYFKREVYRRALTELARHLSSRRRCRSRRQAETAAESKAATPVKPEPLPHG